MRSFNRILVIALVLFSCSKPRTTILDPKLSWEEIENLAKGQSVTFMMWQGDLQINSYIQNFVKPNVWEKYGIRLQVISGQGNVIVNTLRAELEAGASSSQIDIMWINGETFYQLKEIRALYGPFTDKLPNYKFVDSSNPFIAVDFQQPISGYECPWGNVQLTWIYDSLTIGNSLPQNLQNLADWCKKNPGKFTISTEFTGLTVLKSFLYEIAGGQNQLNGAFDETKYIELSGKLWSYMKGIREYMWREGQEYPATLSHMHQLFSTGQIAFTFSNNDCEVDNKIRQGVFPESARAYVPDIGSIQNSHYLGISSLSSQKAGALVVINYLISVESQVEKMKPEIWGDGTVLAMKALSAEERIKFESVSPRIYAPTRPELTSKALSEPDPTYMIRLYEDFRKFIESK